MKTNKPFTGVLTNTITAALLVITALQEPTPLGGNAAEHEVVGAISRLNDQWQSQTVAFLKIPAIQFYSPSQNSFGFPHGKKKTWKQTEWQKVKSFSTSFAGSLGGSAALRRSSVSVQGEGRFKRVVMEYYVGFALRTGLLGFHRRSPSLLFKSCKMEPSS